MHCGFLIYLWNELKADGNWTLMCPDECPGLSDVYGDEFKELYEKYETRRRGRVTMSARKLWFQILDAQMETGTPYLCYKDAANRKSNQKILVSLNRLIYVQRLWKFLTKKKVLYVIWQVLHCHHVLKQSKMEILFIILKNYILFHALLHSI
jgi:hypothetical protein